MATSILGKQKAAAQAEADAAVAKATAERHAYLKALYFKADGSLDFDKLSAVERKIIEDNAGKETTVDVSGEDYEFVGCDQDLIDLALESLAKTKPAKQKGKKKG